MNIFLRVFAVVLHSAVVSALMLKPAVLGGDVDKEPKLLVEEPPAVAILKADLRPIIFLDTNHLGGAHRDQRRYLAETQTSQRYV